MSEELNERPEGDLIEVTPDPEVKVDEPPEAEESKSPEPTGDRNSMSIDIENFKSHESVIAQEYQKVVNNYFNGSQGFSNILIKHFEFNDIWRITSDKQEEISHLYAGDPTEIERLRSLLFNKRILVLSGEAELGKTTTAIYLGNLLSTAGCRNKSNKSMDTYLIPSLDRYTRIDLNEIWNARETTNRVVIFKNVFARGNNDLRGFFAQLNEHSVGEFANRLRDSNSYLIVTTTAADASRFISGYAVSDLHYELKPLTDDLLCEGLEKRLKHLERTTKPAKERLEKLRTPEQQKIVIAGLRTMPRIVRFVTDYLNSDSTIDLETDLSEAIRQFEDITYWFRQELAADFEVWCFTLALGLSHWAADSQSVPWIDFDYVHRGIAQYLRRDPQVFPGRKDTKEQEPLDIVPRLTDDAYLAQSRAEVVKDPNSLGDVIRFCQETYPTKLWEIFLKHHRRVLTTLLPRLRDLVENDRTEADFGQRELCARIIGRVGEIDPERVTLSVMNRWINSDDVRQRADIGALYQGILASSNERYKSYFLEVLKSLTASVRTSEEGDEVDLEEREEAKEKLLTAMAVYSQIGTYDLALAMKGLKTIATDRLVPTINDAHRIGRFMERLYKQEASTFVGIQYAVSTLCLSVHPISVFRELRIWIESSNQATGVLVALMFLIKDGIASTLESVQVDVSGSSSSLAEQKNCNPIVVALTSGKESIVEMARFMVTIFEAFSVTFFLSKQFQDYLRKSYLAHLTTWIEAALPIENCCQAMEELLTELMRIHDRVLFKPIDSYLSSPVFLKRDSDLKQAFVNAVRWPNR